MNQPVPTTVTIHLVRHGEVFNPRGILYGRMPGWGLSDRGHAMAQLIGEVLPKLDPHIQALVASPLLRAQETIQPLSQHLELPVLTEPRVLEAGNQFEGVHVTPRSLVTSAKYLYWVRNPLRPSWGEPYLEQALRMRAAMMSLRARLVDSARESGLTHVSGVIVSHQLPIWATRRFTQGDPLWHDPRKRQCALGSVTSFRDAGRVLSATTYRDICEDLQPAESATGA